MILEFFFLIHFQLRTTTRELTMSEEPLSYVRQLSQQFLNVISDVVKEFLMQPEHFSLILHWCSGELSVMLSLIRRHVIEVRNQDFFVI